MHPCTSGPGAMLSHGRDSLGTGESVCSFAFITEISAHLLTCFCACSIHTSSYHRMTEEYSSHTSGSYFRCVFSHNQDEILDACSMPMVASSTNGLHCILLLLLLLVCQTGPSSESLWPL